MKWKYGMENLIRCSFLERLIFVQTFCIVMSIFTQFKLQNIFLIIKACLISWYHQKPIITSKVPKNHSLPSFKQVLFWLYVHYAIVWIFWILWKIFCKRVVMKLTPTHCVKKSEWSIRVENVDSNSWVEVESFIEQPIGWRQLGKHFETQQCFASPFLENKNL